MFYVPLLEVFSITEHNAEGFKACFAHSSISKMEIFSRTNLYTTRNTKKDFSPSIVKCKPR